ncbi:hypothetical protein BLNAU_14382 [Blattamonas nauphoetae]|uniref:Uncharacterized protein n=1 Tax=Blattamonas nauphoetae TaxID=2049346 RepID=A0ABQ9XKD6_9EUKA|nr:hypothetical protein BLNAU_14382 [Blattamonas nauphoetae]
MNTQQSTLTDSSCPDCSAFLNWTEETLASNDEIGNIFRFLIATVKLQPALDASLEAKAVELLNYVVPDDEESECTFLDQFASSSDDSLIDFILSIVVLLSSPSQTITTKSMKILDTLFHFCSEKVHLALVKADLIPQLINTLNPQTLSFAEGVDIHTRLIYRITHPFWLATPNNLKKLGIKDDYEQQAVHETILKQVLAPSEENKQKKQRTFRTVLTSLGPQTLFSLANLARWSPHSPSPWLPLTHFSDVEGNPSETDTCEDDSEGSEGVVAEFKTVLDPCSVATHTLPLPSTSPLTTLGVERAGDCSFETHTMLASTVFLLPILSLVVSFTLPSSLYSTPEVPLRNGQQVKYGRGTRGV